MKFNKFSIILSPILIAVLILGSSCLASTTTPVAAEGNVYYVAKNGSHKNPGTSDSPWLTIQHASETMVAGDQVLIREGTYHEHVYTLHSGDAENYIVFSAYPDETPIIDGTGVTESQNGFIIDQPYIKLMGLEISNWDENAIWIENAADSLYMYNSILSGGDNIDLDFEQMNTSNYKVDYNLFYNDYLNRTIVVGYTDEFSLDKIDDWKAYSGQDVHLLVAHSVTEIFTSPVSSDFHLLDTSLAVDNGTNTGAPSEDYEGNPRPQGDKVDIGAYER